MLLNIKKIHTKFGKLLIEIKGKLLRIKLS